MRRAFSARPHFPASSPCRAQALPRTIATSARPARPRPSLSRAIAARANSTLEAARTAPGNADEEVFVQRQAQQAQERDDRPMCYSTPMREYEKLVERGALRADDHQTRIVQHLQDLHDALTTYDPPAHRTVSNSLLSRIFSTSTSTSGSSSQPPPHGLYLYGDVGTGKTMLMDLFFRTLPPRVKRRRRVHFHAFMIDVHKRVHAAKAGGGDPIAPVARKIAEEASVLCFDEFQVTDIADAMILRRLLEVLLDHGVVCVITSNRHPDDLYKNGIQRSSFVPAIELLKTSFDVIDLDSGTDYRRVPRALSNVYYSPLDETSRGEIGKLFKALTADEPVVRGRELHIWGRALRVPQSTEHVAMFGFDDLCAQPLSAADYLEVTKTFGTVFLCDVPRMGLSEKDKARRFITFIDACYESKTKLFVSSELPIYQIFSDDSKSDGQIPDHMRSVMDDLGLPADIVGASSMFSGEEELFAFARCCSRLVQMGSREWAETAGVR